MTLEKLMNIISMRQVLSASRSLEILWESYLGYWMYGQEWCMQDGLSVLQNWLVTAMPMGTKASRIEEMATEIFLCKENFEYLQAYIGE